MFQQKFTFGMIICYRDANTQLSQLATFGLKLIELALNVIDIVDKIKSYTRFKFLPNFR